jgi:hypothetical protein
MNGLTRIQHIEVPSGGQAGIEFNSIPQTFTDLIIYFSGRCQNAVTDLGMRYNGSDSGYTMRLLYGDGTNFGSGPNTSAYLVWAGQSNSSGYTSNTFSNSRIYISNYTSNEHKLSSHDAVTENNATAATQVIAAGIWANNAPITSILLTLAPSLGGNFVQYSSATLYGITKGSSGGVTVS